MLQLRNELGLWLVTGIQSARNSLLGIGLIPKISITPGAQMHMHGMGCIINVYYYMFRCTIGELKPR